MRKVFGPTRTGDGYWRTKTVFGPTRTGDGYWRTKTNQEINYILNGQNIIGYITE